MKFLNFSIVSITLILTGCATGGFVGTLVDEKAPTSNMALIKPLEGVIVESIDGQKVGVNAGTHGHAHDYEIGLKPGRHRAVLRYLFVPQGLYGSTTSTATSYGPTTIDLDVDAGHRYLIKPNLPWRGSGMKTWEPYLMDMTNNESCWSVFLEMGFFRTRHPECKEAAAARKN